MKIRVYYQVTNYFRVDMDYAELMELAGSSDAELIPLAEELQKAPSFITIEDFTPDDRLTHYLVNYGIEIDSDEPEITEIGRA